MSAIPNDTAINLENGRWLSSFNEKGMNITPFVVNDHHFLLASADHMSPQTDLYAFDLKAQTYEMLTATDESESYPSTQKKGIIRCIKKHSNGESLLWDYPDDLSHGGRCALSDVTNIVNYVMLDSNLLVAFLEGNPDQLAIINLDNNNKYVFTSNIGPTLKVVNGKVFFIHKISEANWYLKRYDPLSKKSTIVVKMPGQVEQFEMLSESIAICAMKEELLIYSKALKGYVEKAL